MYQPILIILICQNMPKIHFNTTKRIKERDGPWTEKMVWMYLKIEAKSKSVRKTWEPERQKMETFLMGEITAQASRWNRTIKPRRHCAELKIFKVGTRIKFVYYKSHDGNTTHWNGDVHRQRHETICRRQLALRHKDKEKCVSSPPSR